MGEFPAYWTLGLPISLVLGRDEQERIPIPTCGSDVLRETGLEAQRLGKTVSRMLGYLQTRLLLDVTLKNVNFTQPMEQTLRWKTDVPRGGMLCFEKAYFDPTHERYFEVRPSCQS